MTRARTAVLGAGAWGSALANVASSGREHVALWGHDPAHMADVGCAIARTGAICRDCRWRPLWLRRTISRRSRTRKSCLASCPRKRCVRLARLARPFCGRARPSSVCAKGIERGSHKFMSEVLAEEAPQVEFAVLSGPSFAKDVCKGLPTAVTLAAGLESLAQELCAQLSTKTFRLYRSTDVRGVEIGGAAKNVLAIACGMAAGRELGASAQAALIARGFAELARLGAAWGARQETLMGLSGLGDLVLTCGSDAIAQLCARAGARARRESTQRGQSRQAGGRRLYGLGPRRTSLGNAALKCRSPRPWTPFSRPLERRGGD